MREAKELTKTGVLWVHEIDDGSNKGIASIVATTRQGPTVTAITKVFTNPSYRSRGCAERLVRRVCHQWVTLLRFVNQLLIFGPACSSLSKRRRLFCSSHTTINLLPKYTTALVLRDWEVIRKSKALTLGLKQDSSIPTLAIGN